MRLISILSVAMSTLVMVMMGVRLPFVSYAGTLLLSLFIGIGILVSAQAHRKLAHL